MESNPDITRFEMMCLVVNFGLGSKVIKTAKKHGVSGGTIFLGKGTIKNRLLEFLDLSDVRKEIVLMISEKTFAYKALEELKKQLSLHKPNRGIAFTTSVMNVIGARNCNSNHIEKSRGVDNAMYQAIFTIVDKGKAEEVIEVATQAGSKGGTIINARGSGIHETNMLFAMPIEPEKEIIMILSESHLTTPIVSSIRDRLNIDQPGNGILFILDVNQAYGLS
ncbi:P-II family nitrogen regulator [Hazenella coriacea]|uniref:Nitrogen regulatory protein P-II family n=1 Tax=Hazenella coriacea TaxID=1179467 RepID=A0A4R3L7F5_9BACL|nr:P-II family nitrogen regulator [Hazenella coriacea]TCS95881.1 nitrogen regulatory protein P-II family [Hazenella coriacea]